VLLPCPFCGGEAEFERLGTGRQSCIVACVNCGARHESSDEDAHNGDSWNIRAKLSEQEPVAFVDEKGALSPTLKGVVELKNGDQLYTTPQHCDRTEQHESQSLLSGDRRQYADGTWWECTDPDIGRWVCNGEDGKALEPKCDRIHCRCGMSNELVEAANEHTDDLAVDRFAHAMKQKLAQAREKGRGGWQECSQEELSRMLRDHIDKGDPRDVANFCMFLWNLGWAIEQYRGK
jgi:Lar family restriction alleviation protein